MSLSGGHTAQIPNTQFVSVFERKALPASIVALQNVLVIEDKKNYRAALHALDTLLSPSAKEKQIQHLVIANNLRARLRYELAEEYDRVFDEMGAFRKNAEYDNYTKREAPKYLVRLYEAERYLALRKIEHSKTADTYGEGVVNDYGSLRALLAIQPDNIDAYRNLFRLKAHFQRRLDNLKRFIPQEITNYQNNKEIKDRLIYKNLSMTCDGYEDLYLKSTVETSQEIKRELLRSITLLMDGQLDNAIHIFSELKDIYGDYPFILMMEGLAYSLKAEESKDNESRRKSDTTAKHKLSECINQSEPRIDCPQAHLMLAQIDERQGDFLSAYYHFSIVLKDAMEGYESFSELPINDLRRAKQFVDHHEKFIESYRTWEKASLDVKSEKSTEFLNDAEAKLKTHQVNAAIDLCTYAVMTDPTNRKAYQLRAHAHLEANQFLQAANDYRMVAEQFNERLSDYELVAKHLNNQTDRKDFIEELKKSEAERKIFNAELRAVEEKKLAAQEKLAHQKLDAATIKEAKRLASLIKDKRFCEFRGLDFFECQQAEKKQVSEFVHQSKLEIDTLKKQQGVALAKLRALLKAEQEKLVNENQVSAIVTVTTVTLPAAPLSDDSKNKSRKKNTARAKRRAALQNRQPNLKEPSAVSGSSAHHQENKKSDVYTKSSTSVTVFELAHVAAKTDNVFLEDNSSQDEKESDVVSSSQDSPLADSIASTATTLTPASNSPVSSQQDSPTTHSPVTASVYTPSPVPCLSLTGASSPAFFSANASSPVSTPDSDNAAASPVPWSPFEPGSLSTGKLKYPEQAKEILKELHEFEKLYKTRVFIHGGFVRDTLRNDYLREKNSSNRVIYSQESEVDLDFVMAVKAGDERRMLDQVTEFFSHSDTIQMRCHVFTKTNLNGEVIYNFQLGKQNGIKINIRLSSYIQEAKFHDPMPGLQKDAAALDFYQNAGYASLDGRLYLPFQQTIDDVQEKTLAIIDLRKEATAPKRLVCCPEIFFRWLDASSKGRGTIPVEVYLDIRETAYRTSLSKYIDQNSGAMNSVLAKLLMHGAGQTHFQIFYNSQLLSVLFAIPFKKLLLDNQSSVATVRILQRIRQILQYHQLIPREFPLPPRADNLDVTYPAYQELLDKFYVFILQQEQAWFNQFMFTIDNRCQEKMPQPFGNLSQAKPFKLMQMLIATFIERISFHIGGILSCLNEPPVIADCMNPLDIALSMKNDLPLAQAAFKRSSTASGAEQDQKNFIREMQTATQFHADHMIALQVMQQQSAMGGMVTPSSMKLVPAPSKNRRHQLFDHHQPRGETAATAGHHTQGRKSNSGRRGRRMNRFATAE